MWFNSYPVVPDETALNMTNGTFTSPAAVIGHIPNFTTKTPLAFQTDKMLLNVREIPRESLHPPTHSPWYVLLYWLFSLSHVFQYIEPAMGRKCCAKEKQLRKEKY